MPNSHHPLCARAQGASHNPANGTPSSRCCLSHARRCVWWRQARRHDPSTGQACCLRFHLGPSLISLPLTLVGQLLRREACATGGLPWSAPSELVSRSRGVAWSPDECSDQLGGSPGQRRRWQRQRQRAGLLLTAGQLPFGCLSSGSSFLPPAAPLTAWISGTLPFYWSVQSGRGACSAGTVTGTMLICGQVSGACLLVLGSVRRFRWRR